MLIGIDHLVVVVNDLERAARDYEQLGFTVVPGGKHPVGSHNVLIPFADGSYIEIIAFYRQAADHRWWEPLQGGEGLVDYCLRTDDLRQDTATLRAAGVLINDPVPWSRRRPDGYELRWLLSLATGPHRGVAPFLIEDVTPRNERVPQKFDHRNKASGIATVSIAVRDLTEVERWYRAALGRPGARARNEELGAEAVCFDVGPHRLEFLKPVTAEGSLVDWIRTHGPSPYSARLLSGSGEAVAALDSERTHGARLSIGPS